MASVFAHNFLVGLVKVVDEPNFLLVMPVGGFGGQRGDAGRFNLASVFFERDEQAAVAFNELVGTVEDSPRKQVVFFNLFASSPLANETPARVLPQPVG